MLRTRWIFVALVLCGETTAQPLHQQLYEAGFPALQNGITFSITIPLDRRPAYPNLSRRSVLEMGAVAVTGLGHLAFSQIDASAVFIPLASVAWGSYVFYRANDDPDFLREIGLSKDGFGRAFRDATLVAAGSLAIMAGVGVAQGSLHMDQDMVPLLVLYPVWGLVQQTLVQAFVARNLAHGTGWVSSGYLIVPVTAAAFSSVHLPNWELTAGTFGLGMAYTPIYLRHQNLWPLGLYHGWLGVLYYFWVLDKNPWKTVVD